MESLLLRLLKAVLMPMTIRYFLLPIDSETLKSSETGEPLSNDSCRVLAADSSVSKVAIVLSSVLQPKHLEMPVSQNHFFRKKILSIKEQICAQERQTWYVLYIMMSILIW